MARRKKTETEIETTGEEVKTEPKPVKAEAVKPCVCDGCNELRGYVARLMQASFGIDI